MTAAERFSIVGPPGCGKTSTIKRQLVEAADRYGPSRLAVASLTRAAIAEIVGRDIPVPHDQARTLHGLAYGALGGSLSLATGREAVTDWNIYCAERGQPALQLPLRSDADIDDSDDDGEPEWMQSIQRYRARMVNPELWDVESRSAYALWCEWKDSRGHLDFTDLIERAATQTAYAPGAPEVLFVDEAQDIDRLMLSLLDRWAGQMRYIVMVGDPDQCLYEWRGSDPNLIHHGYTAIRTLSQSYRVPQAVHAEAVRWIEETPGRVPVAYYPTDYPGEVEDGSYLRSSDPRGVIDAAEEYAAEGTVMLLAQSRYPLAGLVREMRRRGLPFHNPYRTKNGQWNPLGQHRRGSTSTASRVLAFCSPNSKILGEPGRPWRGRDVAQWAPMIRAKGVISAGQKARLESLAEDADWPVVMRTLEDAIEPDALLPLLRADPDWLARNAVDSYASRIEYPAAVLAAHGARSLREPPGIIIGTIHSVKGGEANTVILLPDLTPAAYMEFEAGGDAEAGVRRLIYVGMTRARRRLVLCGAKPRQYAVQWA